MTEPEVQKLLQRYLDGHCTPQESLVVEQLYEQLGRPASAPLSQPEQEKLLGAMWQRLEARTQPRVMRNLPQPVAFWQTPALRWAAAALITVGVSAGLLLPTRSPKPIAAQTTNPAPTSSWTRHSNATQQEQTITLPDGSLVTLHPGSSLRYVTGFAGPKREVHFTGDAFFKVSKDPRRPFLVLTKQVVTTVLGTSFRVQALDSSPDATVTVREGRVSVQARTNAQLGATPNRPAANGVLLLPNQQVVYSGAANRLRKELATVPAVLAPQSFVFDARPVPEVLAALEKAYGVDIEFERDAVANCTVTLDLTHKSLVEKLNVLCEALNATYEEDGTRILFHGQGCRRK